MKPLEKSQVLVVDDEYGPRESIAFSLSAEFGVDTAERAHEAISKLKEKSYSAIVMDIRMPEMDGIRAVEEIRKVDSYVSIIMLTGYGTLLTAQQAMLAGANQYLKKPPDVVELVSAVRRQAEATKLRRRQARLGEDARLLNLALKAEIDRNEPQIWQARASVELVHDLNSPLTIVIGYAALLTEEALSLALKEPVAAQKVLEYSRMVERAAEYCHYLSENWRAASKKTEAFTRVDIIRVVAEVHQVIFFGSLLIQYEGLSEGFIRGSKYELMRIFQNIFKNSSEAGAQKIIVRCLRVGGMLEITIRDDGAGMDGNQLNRILRGGVSTKPNGTGLGLSICRHLVGVHGGNFSLNSEFGKGTTAVLSFPAQD